MLELLIEPRGRMHCVYTEQIELQRLGRLSIRRASHVEPTGDGQWTADLTPVDGPVLGPFPRRSDALQAETAWLSQHWLTRSPLS